MVNYYYLRYLIGYTINSSLNAPLTPLNLLGKQHLMSSKSVESSTETFYKNLNATFASGVTFSLKSKQDFCKSHS